MKILVIPVGIGDHRLSAVLRREPVCLSPREDDLIIAELYARPFEDWQFEDVTSADAMKHFGVPFARFEEAVDDVVVEIVVDDRACDASVHYGSSNISTTREVALSVAAFFGLKVKDTCGLQDVDVARCGAVRGVWKELPCVSSDD